MTTTTARAGWLIPTGLITLSLVPVLGSTLRVVKLSTGTGETPKSAHFYAMPVPVLVHVCAASIYLLLGAFQFARGVRGNRPGWHRWAGRLLIPCGLAVASSGIWMVLFYPRQPGFGERLLAVFQIGFASGWILCLVLGFRAIRGGDIARHRVWMMRGYAIGIGTGTQVFTLLPFSLAIKDLDQVSTAMLMLAGWAINLVVVEVLAAR